MYFVSKKMYWTILFIKAKIIFFPGMQPHREPMPPLNCQGDEKALERPSFSSELEAAALDTSHDTLTVCQQLLYSQKKKRKFDRMKKSKKLAAEDWRSPR